MIITAKIRKNLLALFEGVSYRQIVADKIGCHPNTVSNVLLYEHDNTLVATELLLLGKEIKDQKEADEKKAHSLASQL